MRHAAPVLEVRLVKLLLLWLPISLLLLLLLPAWIHLLPIRDRGLRVELRRCWHALHLRSRLPGLSWRSWLHRVLRTRRTRHVRIGWTELLEIWRYERLGVSFHHRLLLIYRLGFCLFREVGLLFLFLRFSVLDQTFPVLKHAVQIPVRTALLNHFADHIFPLCLPGLEQLAFVGSLSFDA